MSGCTLRFTRNSPVRTTLVDEATGHVMYKIETPTFKFAHVATQIRKVESHTQPPLHLEEDTYTDSGDDTTDDEKMDDKFYSDEESQVDLGLPEISDEMARIYWKLLAQDKIVFQGRIHGRSQFLPKCGKMGGSYTFTGPDGVQYRWALGAMGMHVPKLVTADEKKTVIAEFHRPHNLTNKQKGRLEVHPQGMKMLDHIVLTFAYVERKRRQREKSSSRLI